MILTKKEIIDICKKNADLMDSLQYSSHRAEPVKVGEIEFKNVERKGGCEGGGDEFWFVFSVSDGQSTDYWQVNGFYQSNYGTEFDISDMYPVKSKRVEISVWEAIKD